MRPPSVQSEGQHFLVGAVVAIFVERLLGLVLVHGTYHDLPLDPEFAQLLGEHLCPGETVATPSASSTSKRPSWATQVRPPPLDMSASRIVPVLAEGATWPAI